MLGGLHARVCIAVHCLKNLLFKRLGDYWLECSCADVTKEELTVYVLCDQPQSGVGT